VSWTLKEFRPALHACKELYRSSGFEIAQYNPDLIQETPHEFMSRMLDLERGLVIKIFVAVALADGPWTPEELRLGADLQARSSIPLSAYACNLLLRVDLSIRLMSKACCRAHGNLAPRREYAWSLKDPFVRIDAHGRSVPAFASWRMQVAFAWYHNPSDLW